MNTKLLAFILVFISFNSASQNSQIEKGEIIKDRQFMIDKTEITTCDENGVFVSIRPHRVNNILDNYYIEIFDNLNFIDRHEIKTENSTKILDVFIKKKEVHILIKEKSKEHISLRYDLFNLDKKTITQKSIISIKKNENKPIYNALKNDKQIFINHKTNYALSFPVIDNDRIYTYLEYFDDNLNSLSKHSIYPNKNASKKNATFLNINFHNNKAYILYSISENKSSNYYQLSEFNKIDTKNLMIPIEENIHELINTRISKNNFIISGLFSKQKKGAFEGFTFYNINLDSFEIASKKLSNFHTEDARKYFIGLFKNNRSIDIKDIFIDDTNNIYLIGQFYTIRKQHIPIGITITIGATAYFSYNPISIKYKIYDDILISKIDTNGKLIWDTILKLRQTEKIQSKSNKKDSSYASFLENNQLNIIMNGFINMEKEKLIMKQDKRNSKTNFYNIIVASDGKIIPKIIFPNTESEILFRSEATIKSKNNTFFNLGQGNMRKQLIKVKL